MFICIVGMDGSGKTTLTQNVLSSIKETGLTADYVYGRFQPLLLRPVLWAARRVLLRGRTDRGNYPAYALQRRRLFANPTLYWLYQSALAVDYLVQVAWRIRIPLWRGRSLVCDRYYIDTVVADIAIDAKQPENTAKRLLAAYRLVLPKPDMILMTDVPASVAVARKSDIPSLEYAEGLRELYLYAATCSGVDVLDGTYPPEQLLNAALDRLGLPATLPLEVVNV